MPAQRHLDCGREPATARSPAPRAQNGTVNAVSASYSRRRSPALVHRAASDQAASPPPDSRSAAFPRTHRPGKSVCPSDLLRDSGRQHGFSAGDVLPGRGASGFRSPEARLQFFLDPVHPLVSLGDGPIAWDPDMDCAKLCVPLVRVRRSWGAREFGIFGTGGEETRAQILRPFAIHQLIQRALDDLQAPNEQPCGDQTARTPRRAPARSGILIERSAPRSPTNSATGRMRSAGGRSKSPATPSFGPRIAGR